MNNESTPSPETRTLSRRAALQWVVAAGAAIPLSSLDLFAEEAAPVTGQPYGTDPVLNKVYKPGDLWPLTLAPGQRRTVSALCDLILPADDRSPSASAVGVPEFIDEWISAPYPVQRKDRETVLAGLTWLEAESRKRFQKGFVELSVAEQSAIADDIVHPKRAKAGFEQAAVFFAAFRNLVLTGFYTTPAGMKDIGFIGNVALAKFPEPPKEALEKLGLV
jgi:hypothetical protein